jgi:hypothetical protein
MCAILLNDGDEANVGVEAIERLIFEIGIF